jgi:carbon monoxide dehydrogenase subunit G
LREDSYTMVVSAGVGAVRGKYSGEVRLSDLSFPKSYVMHASGSGGPGSVRATVQIGLAPAGEGTELTWSADAVVGGAVAGVGQRMITGVAKRMAGQFFAAVDKELSAPNVVADVTPSAAAAGDTRVQAAAGGSAEPSTPMAPVTYGKTPAAAAGWVPAEAKPLLVGAAGGGLLTLLGVWVGYLLGRRG